MLGRLGKNSNQMQRLFQGEADEAVRLTANSISLVSRRVAENGQSPAITGHDVTEILAAHDRFDIVD